DETELVRAEVENIHTVVRVRDGAEDRGDAVLHVKVRLPLPAVALDPQLGRMLEKLFVKVEHVAVRVPLAEDRHEEEDKRVEAKALAVGLNQSFAGELGCAVEGCLHREWSGLRRWKDRGLAVHRSGRRECDAVNAIRSHGFENVEGRHSIL